MRFAVTPFVLLLAAACSTSSTDSSASNVNHAPTAPVVAITPASATTEQDLVVGFTTDAEDPDFDAVTYTYAWSVDGEARDDLTGDTVPASETTRGQTWTVTVTPNDGELDGPAATAEATIVNSPPEATVALTPDDPVPSEDLVATATATDADGDAVSFTYAWLRDGEATEFTEATLPAGTAVRGETWTVRATPADDADAGEPAEASVTFGNELPVVEGVTLAPAPAFAPDTITATAGATSDADGDAVSLTYTFSVNGTDVQSGSSNTLAPGAFHKHDIVAVTVTPNDGLADGPAARSADLSVLNSPPTLGNARIDPGALTESTVASCLPEGPDDVDGDSITYTYQWTVNGTAVATTETLDGTSFSRGDTVTCTLVPDDGEQPGAGVTSVASSVGNSAPEITSALLTNTSPGTRDNLDVDLVSTDADGDAVNYQFEWFVNGTSVGTTRSLTGDNFSSGDTVYAVVTPMDGITAGTPVTSDVATVVNTLPELGPVNLGPPTPGTNDTLTANAVASDADGDTVSLTYAWYVNGALVGATGSSLDGATWFDRGDTVYVTVTPADASGSGTAVTSSTVTVGNSRPSSPTVAISPSDPMVGEDLVCTITSPATDADGDALTYSVTWRVGGTTYAGSTTGTWSGDTIPGDATNAHEAWTCAATANDGTDDGPAGMAPANVDPNLMAWYPFDGDATDQSGNHRDGTVTEAALGTDRHGNAASAYDFDGVNDQIVTAPVTFSAPLTVVAWAKSSSVNDLMDSVFSWNTPTAPYGGFQLMANGDGAMRGRVGGESDDLLTSSTPDGDGAWHFYALTRTSAGVTSFYVDGVLENTGSNTTTLASAVNLYLGRSFEPTSFDEFFHGSIDDVRVYSTALDASQIARLAAL